MASSKSGEIKSARKSPAQSAQPGLSALGDAAIHPDMLRQIVAVLEGADITRLDWRRGEERLVLVRGHAPPAMMVHAPAAAPAFHPSPVAASAPQKPEPQKPEAAKPGTVVTSPFVGTFYRSPSPDAPSFVEVGAPVRKGQVLCIVEAMKLMNEIEAEAPGKLAEVLAENGQTVEFGQPLFRIEPA
jgi:acetyl-CoA carboxylase biotin carboxyl carrier protein